MHRRDIEPSQPKKRTKDPHKSPFYGRLVPAYNAVWPAVAARGIAIAIRAFSFPPGARLLEVGVGTGISLKHYPTNISIVGVDLSESMLGEAEDRIADNDWNHVTVEPMNAENLTFEDNSFDIVTSFHTVSVVSNPQKMMSEVVRVCRPGGRILVVNHFRSKRPIIAKVVDRASDITRHLGWRTDLGSDDVFGPLPVRLDRTYKAHSLSLFTVVEATCIKPDPTSAMTHKTTHH
jgi:phosphatidylethanolamine/phosphatidyl-N-methylethanolamine N-methyltransferase